MYVFTNTKKVDIISAQKYFRDLPKKQINGIAVEKGPAIGSAIQQTNSSEVIYRKKKGGTKR